MLRKLVWALSLFYLPAAFAAEGVPILRIPKVSHPPTLAQFLASQPREAELHVTGFVQREPGDGVPVSQPTDAYLSYDDKNLYIVFVCQDDPSKIRAHLGKREQLDGDDFVGVILDTFHDRQRAYGFLVNPLGVQSDAIEAEGANDDWSYDALWHSDGQITRDGYIVWMAIPFRSLRFRRAPQQEWGIFLCRFITRNNEGAFYPQFTRRLASFLTQTGTLQGIEQVSPGRNMQFIPYGFYAHSRSLDTGAPKYTTDNTFRGGFDSKLVLRDSLTLDFTVNPDFSQVESDEPQVTVNQRYEVYFPERRPFFIENSDFFKTPENLFFTRRIVDPEFGSRLTGTVGRWKVAALMMDDRAAGAVLPASDPHHEERALIGIGRVRREFGKQNSVGMIFTNRDFAGAYNRVAGLDTRLFFGKHWTFSGQAIQSLSRDAAGRQYSGPAYYADVAYYSRAWNISSTYTDRSPDFDSALGFIDRVDIRRFSQEFGRNWFPKKSGALQKISAAVVGYVDWDHRSIMQDWSVEPQFEVQLSRQTWIEVARRTEYERFQNLGFPKHQTFLMFESSPTRWFTADVVYAWGRTLNYDPAATLLPFPASFRKTDASFTLIPKSKLQVSLRYLWSWYGLHGNQTSPGAAHQPFLNNHIARAKVNYQFTRRLSLRGIMDYNAVLPNAALFASPRTKRLTGDVLATYVINPWTAFYVGYTDQYDNLVFDNAGLRRTPSPTNSTGRQFFAKVSYLLRF